MKNMKKDKGENKQKKEKHEWTTPVIREMKIEDTEGSSNPGSDGAPAPSAS